MEIIPTGLGQFAVAAKQCLAGREKMSKEKTGLFTKLLPSMVAILIMLGGAS